MGDNNDRWTASLRDLELDLIDGSNSCLRWTERGGRALTIVKWTEETKTGNPADKNTSMFPTSEVRTRKLTNNATKWRSRDAGVSEKIGYYTFPATGITVYFQNKVTLEFAQKLRCHAPV